MQQKVLIDISKLRPDSEESFVRLLVRGVIRSYHNGRSADGRFI